MSQDFATYMPCSNTAALERHELDQILRSHIDVAAERHQERLEWRADRKAELEAMSAKELGDQIAINLDYGDVLDELILALTVNPSLEAAQTVLAQAIERVLDVEEQHGDFR